MSNEILLQQSVEFTEIADGEMEQISGGDKIIQIFNPYSFGYDNRGGDDNYGGHGGHGKGKGKGHY
jgi:hypothetical protein